MLNLKFSNLAFSLPYTPLFLSTYKIKLEDDEKKSKWQISDASHFFSKLCELN